MSKSKNDQFNRGPLLIKIEACPKRGYTQRCSKECTKECSKKSYTIFDPKPSRRKSKSGSSERGLQSSLNSSSSLQKSFLAEEKGTFREKEYPEPIPTDISQEQYLKQHSKFSETNSLLNEQGRHVSLDKDINVDKSEQSIYKIPKKTSEDSEIIKGTSYSQTEGTPYIPKNLENSKKQPRELSKTKQMDLEDEDNISLYSDPNADIFEQCVCSTNIKNEKITGGTSQNIKCPRRIIRTSDQEAQKSGQKKPTSAVQKRKIPLDGEYTIEISVELAQNKKPVIKEQRISPKEREEAERAGYYSGIPGELAHKQYLIPYEDSKDRKSKYPELADEPLQRVGPPMKIASDRRDESKSVGPPGKLNISLDTSHVETVDASGNVQRVVQNKKEISDGFGNVKIVEQKKEEISDGLGNVQRIIKNKEEISDRSGNVQKIEQNKNEISDGLGNVKTIIKNTEEISDGLGNVQRVVQNKKTAQVGSKIFELGDGSPTELDESGISAKRLEYSKGVGKPPKSKRDGDDWQYSEFEPDEMQVSPEHIEYSKEIGRSPKSDQEVDDWEHLGFEPDEYEYSPHHIKYSKGVGKPMKPRAYDDLGQPGQFAVIPEEDDGFIHYKEDPRAKTIISEPDMRQLFESLPDVLKPSHRLSADPEQFFEPGEFSIQEKDIPEQRRLIYDKGKSIPSEILDRAKKVFSGPERPLLGVEYKGAPTSRAVTPMQPSVRSVGASTFSRPTPYIGSAGKPPQAIDYRRPEIRSTSPQRQAVPYPQADAYQEPSCLLEICVLEKHIPGCKFRKDTGVKIGDYDVKSRQTFKTCGSSPGAVPEKAGEYAFGKSSARSLQSGRKKLPETFSPARTPMTQSQKKIPDTVNKMGRETSPANVEGSPYGKPAFTAFSGDHMSPMTESQLPKMGIIPGTTRKEISPADIEEFVSGKTAATSVYAERKKLEKTSSTKPSRAGSVLTQQTGKGPDNDLDTVYSEQPKSSRSPSRTMSSIIRSELAKQMIIMPDTYAEVEEPSAADIEEYVLGRSTATPIYAGRKRTSKTFTSTTSSPAMSSMTRSERTIPVRDTDEGVEKVVTPTASRRSSTSPVHSEKKKSSTTASPAMSSMTRSERTIPVRDTDESVEKVVTPTASRRSSASPVHSEKKKSSTTFSPAMSSITRSERTIPVRDTGESVEKVVTPTPSRRSSASPVHSEKKKSSTTSSPAMSSMKRSELGERIVFIADTGTDVQKLASPTYIEAPASRRSSASPVHSEKKKSSLTSSATMSSMTGSKLGERSILASDIDKDVEKVGSPTNIEENTSRRSSASPVHSEKMKSSATSSPAMSSMKRSELGERGTDEDVEKLASPTTSRRSSASPVHSEKKKSSITSSSGMSSMAGSELVERSILVPYTDKDVEKVESPTNIEEITSRRSSASPVHSEIKKSSLTSSAALSSMTGSKLGESSILAPDGEKVASPTTSRRSSASPVHSEKKKTSITSSSGMSSMTGSELVERSILVPHSDKDVEQAASPTNIEKIASERSSASPVYSESKKSSTTSSSVGSEKKKSSSTSTSSSSTTTSSEPAEYSRLVPIAEGDVEKEASQRSFPKMYSPPGSSTSGSYVESLRSPTKSKESFSDKSTSTADSDVLENILPEKSVMTDNEQTRSLSETDTYVESVTSKKDYLSEPVPNFKEMKVKPADINRKPMSLWHRIADLFK